MILVVDVGNTDVVFGVHDENDWKAEWRIPSRTEDSIAYYEPRLRDHFLEFNLRPSAITKVIISSVVPDITPDLSRLLGHMTETDPIILGPEIYKQLPIKILRPYQIGADLVANSMAAHHHSQTDCIVVDFGTALTCTSIKKDGLIAGVAIAPGITTAIKALSLGTAQLPEVPLNVPDSPIGLDTTHAIQAGVLIGYEGLVSRLIERTKSELAPPVKVIVTGGLHRVLKSLEKEYDWVAPKLTLEGLRLIAQLIKK